ncbi:MAG TPA: GNAT family N-acetyltransferase, partial [Candidatus Goldiibacteriota bacterium]|nr:GNAT family N-acetyltransferase [Candidatus Goldiibacteriota bacterium]
MLETGKYFCIRKNNELAAMAGVHFFSGEYGSAAIGNVAVAEKHRGRGMAKSVTASLCLDLWQEAKYIGLNVRADNYAAIKAYTDIGFMEHSRHVEIRAVRKAV